jgi:hypothetical protein
MSIKVGDVIKISGGYREWPINDRGEIEYNNWISFDPSTIGRVTGKWANAIGTFYCVDSEGYEAILVPELHAQKNLAKPHPDYGKYVIGDDVLITATGETGTVNQTQPTGLNVKLDAHSTIVYVTYDAVAMLYNVGDIVRILPGWSSWTDRTFRSRLHHAYHFERSIGTIASVPNVGTTYYRLMVIGLNVSAPAEFLQLVARREDRRDAPEWITKGKED